MGPWWLALSADEIHLTRIREPLFGLADLRMVEDAPYALGPAEVADIRFAGSCWKGSDPGLPGVEPGSKKRI